MTNGWMETTLAQMEMPGVIARLVESHYQANGESSKCEASVELRLRLSGSKIRIRAGRFGGVLANAGRLIMIPANANTHALSDVEQSIRSISLKLEPAWIQDAVGIEDASCLDEVPLNFNYCNDYVHRAMLRISTEILTPGEFSNTIVDACCRLISAEIFRVSHDRRLGSSDEVRDIVGRKRAKAIEEFVYNFGNGCPTLHDVASELHLAVGYVRQFYKSVTGRTLFDFIQEVRIARARDLLAEESIPLKIISHRLGFCTPSAFSVAFKKTMGVTPREYRARGASRIHRETGTESALASREARGGSHIDTPRTDKPRGEGPISVPPFTSLPGSPGMSERLQGAVEPRLCVPPPQRASRRDYGAAISSGKALAGQC